MLLALLPSFLVISIDRDVRSSVVNQAMVTVGGTPVTIRFTGIIELTSVRVLGATAVRTTRTAGRASHDGPQPITAALHAPDDPRTSEHLGSFMARLLDHARELARAHGHPPPRAFRLHPERSPTTTTWSGSNTPFARGSAASGPLWPWRIVDVATDAISIAGLLPLCWIATYSIRLGRLRRERRLARRRTCSNCRYNLHGLRVARCPECGAHQRTARRRKLSGTPHGVKP